jgi:hypothetical protein
VLSANTPRIAHSFINSFPAGPEPTWWGKRLLLLLPLLPPLPAVGDGDLSPALPLLLLLPAAAAALAGVSASSSSMMWQIMAVSS